MTIRTDAYRPSRPHTPAAQITRRILTVGLCALAPLSGCAAWLGKDTPGTRITINPITRTISFEDTRDNDARIEGMEYADGTRQFRVAKLDITQNSSDPRRANAEQMDVALKAQISANETLGAVIGKLIDASPALLGAFAQLRNTGETPVPPSGGTPVPPETSDAGGTPALPIRDETPSLGGAGEDAAGGAQAAPAVVDFPAIFGGQP